MMRVMLWVDIPDEDADHLANQAPNQHLCAPANCGNCSSVMHRALENAFEVVRRLNGPPSIVAGDLSSAS